MSDLLVLCCFLPWLVMVVGYFLEWRKLRLDEEAAMRAERIRRASIAFAQLNALAADAKRQNAIRVLREASGINSQDPAAMRRRALANTHPDRGGSAEKFRNVQQALEVLGL